MKTKTGKRTCVLLEAVALIGLLPAGALGQVVDLGAFNSSYILGTMLPLTAVGSIEIVDGGLLFHTWGAYNSDVTVLDVSNPANMKVASVLPRPHVKDFMHFYALPMAKSGNAVFLADSNWLWVYDVSNPTSPAKKDSVNIGQWITSMTVWNDTVWLTAGIWPSSSSIILYRFVPTTMRISLADTILGGGGDFVGNVSYRTSQYFINGGGGAFCFAYPFPIMGGNYYYFAHGSVIRMHDSLLFSAQANGPDIVSLNQLNISPPPQKRIYPTLITSLNSGFLPTDIAVFKNLLIVCSSLPDSLLVYDISDISNIKEVAKFKGDVSDIGIDTVRNILFAETHNIPQIEIFAIDLTSFTKAVTANGYAQKTHSIVRGYENRYNDIVDIRGRIINHTSTGLTNSGLQSGVYITHSSGAVFRHSLFCHLNH